MRVRVLVGILASGILIFGSMSGVSPAWAQNQDSEQNFQNPDEETARKISQRSMFLNFFIKLTVEKNTVSETIARLEMFQTDDSALQNKIRDNWLPALKEYLKILENLEPVVIKFGKREDIILETEIATEFGKVYPPNTGARIKKIAEEMNEIGFLEKLFKN